MSKTIFIHLVYLVLGSYLGACGPARPVEQAHSPLSPSQPEPSKTSEEEIKTSESSPLKTSIHHGDLIKQLGFKVWIAPDQKFPDFMDPVNSSDFDQKIKSENLNVIITEDLPVFSKAVYFAWPEGSLESPILSAQGIHRVLDSKNQWIDFKVPVSVHYAPKQGHWYIAVSDIYRGLGNLVPSEYTHKVYVQRITLVIRLQNGIAFELNLFFKIVKKIKGK